MQIKTEDGDKIKYRAVEKPCCCGCCISAMNKPVEVNIKNDDGDSIMRLSKGCDIAALGWCCLPSMALYDKENDKDLGSIKVNCALCNINPCSSSPDFSIYDEDGDKRFSSRLPCCTCSNCLTCSPSTCSREFIMPIYDDRGSDIIAEMVFTNFCL